MDQTKITCRLSANGPGLIFAVKIGDQVFFHGDPNGAHDLAITLPDEDSTHQLIFELSGKTIDHTRINSDGEIIQDLTVSISDLAFDDIKLGHVMTQHARYQHDFNGTKNPVDEKFFGTMGCNGTVTLEFTTPIYLWLLENM